VQNPPLVEMGKHVQIWNNTSHAGGHQFKEGCGLHHRLAPGMCVRDVPQPSLELTAVNFNVVLLNLFADWCQKDLTTETSSLPPFKLALLAGPLSRHPLHIVFS